MKYLLGGAAVAAFLAVAMPATAQTTNDTTSKATTSGVSSGKHAGTAMRHKSMARHKQGATAEDTSADELNRRELDRLAQTGTTGAGAGTTTAPRSAVPQQ